jgi:hypothetical protein
MSNVSALSADTFTAQSTSLTGCKQTLRLLAALLFVCGCLGSTVSAQTIDHFTVTDPGSGLLHQPYSCTYYTNPPGNPLCNIGPGNTLEIYGKGFTSAGNVGTCDCAIATTNIWTDTYIKATVNFVTTYSPTVYVETVGGAFSTAYSYVARTPIIDQIQVGPCTSSSTQTCYIGVGQPVKITGYYFGTSMSGSGLQVSMCDCANNATIDNWTNTQITVTATQVAPNSGVGVGLVGLTGWSNSIPYWSVTLNILIPPGITTQNTGLINQYVIPATNPSVAGETFQVEWSEIDPGPPNGSNQDPYDWSYTDGLYKNAPAGKVVNFVFWANADSASNNCASVGQYGLYGTVNANNCAIPKYVWTALTPSNYATDCKNPSGTQWIPNYFNPAFQTNYQNFMKAVIARYGTGSYPNMGYIRFGLGHGGETIPVADWNSGDDCSKQFETNWGLTISTWEGYLKTMLDYEASLHSQVQLMVGITPMGTDNGVPDYVANTAVPLGIGFGSQGLEEKDVNNCAGSTADWCTLFNNNFTQKVPLELQTLAQSCPDSTKCGCPTSMQCATGSLATLLPFATANHVTVLELYYQDWLVALDPGYPGYPGTVPPYPSYATVLQNAANGQ